MYVLCNLPDPFIYIYIYVATFLYFTVNDGYVVCKQVPHPFFSTEQYILKIYIYSQ